MLPLNYLRIVGLLALTTLLPLTSTAAQPPGGVEFDVRKFVCPVGGAKFTQDVGYYAMPLVQFADGSWLGDIEIDVQIPECPGTGLVLIPHYENPDASGQLSYRDYTPEQLARLPALLGSSDFSNLRRKSRHERAQWLATQLGMPATTRMQLLIRASWAARDPAERRRLVERIAEEGPVLVDAYATPEAAKLPTRLLVANALRELGRFDEAEAQLDSIRASIPTDADIKDPDNTRALGTMLAGLYDAIEYRDDDRFPLALSSEKWVSQACNSSDLPPPYGPQTRNAKSACERRHRERQSREDEFQQAMQLGQDPAELERQCRGTPVDKRAPGLAQACEFAQSDSDAKAANDLVLHQASQVAADCEATPAQERKGPLFFACVSYQSALETALADLLVEDDADYAIICDDGKSPPDRAAFASLACSIAEQARLERAIGKLLADPVALATACSVTPANDRDLALGVACDRRQDELLPPLASGQELPANQHAPIHDPPEVNIFHPDSDLNKVARDYAQRVIVRARADGAYPKRKRGDLY